jgi:hypothetical protein
MTRALSQSARAEQHVQIVSIKCKILGQKIIVCVRTILTPNIYISGSISPVGRDITMVSKVGWVLLG